MQDPHETHEPNEGQEPSQEPANEPAFGFESRVDLSELQRMTERVRAEIGKIVVGQRQMVDLLLTALLADGHVLIEGVPGVAKTLTAKIMAKIVAAKFSRIQFTPDLMPSDVLGTMVYNPKDAEFNFKPGPIFANIVLIDEINRAPAKTQAALFEVMEERQITLDGKRYRMKPPFNVLATQNPVEQEGTYRLPEAQLDRFLFKIEVGYPSLEEEAQIVDDYHNRRNAIDLEQIDSFLSPEEIARYREAVRDIRVEPKLTRYIAQIVQGTRESGSLFLGASPRASIAILTSSKAFAAINGRDFVTPDDIKTMVPAVLRHRVVLTPEREMEGSTPAEVVRRIVEAVEVPR